MEPQKLRNIDGISAGGFDHSRNNENKPLRGYQHWYVYVCSDSTETRGKRQGVKSGCGYANIRATKQPIDEHYNPQGAPCRHCGKRQRLNKGMLHSNDLNIRRNEYDRYGTDLGFKDTGVPDLTARKQWANATAGEHNAAWLSKQPNLSEQSDATIEQGGESIE